MAPTIALILFTVRDACAEDLPGTLKRIREVGYEWVQVSGIGKFDPAAVRRAMDDAGLRAAGCHMGMELLDDDMPYVVEAAKTVGMEHVVMPFTKVRSRAETEAMVASLAGHAETLAGHGLQLGYHNHDFEFARWDDGGCMWDLISAVDGLFLELDLGWAWYAERDPSALLAERPGRFPLLHVKDFGGRGEPKRFCPVGDGEVPFGEILKTPEAQAARFAIVEQDQLNGMDWVEAVTRSYRALSSLLA